MGAFNFMETSFIISLGITFVLILLLIYHFKQRLTLTESKQETMFEIINNLAQELNNVKGHISMLSRPATPYPFNNVGGDIQFTHEIMQQNGQPDQESQDEEDDNERIIVSDDEDDDDISVEELSDEDDELSDDEEDDEEEDNSLIVEDIDANVSENSESNQVAANNSEIKEQTPNFSKMNLGSLKAYIVEKGLVEDASKLKKAQILTLIQEQQPAI